jgi:hypothetical protein
MLDTELSVRVRAALAKDQALAPLNIGVNVRDGTVTLWGSVPSADFARRAMSVAGQVKGVQSIRCELSLIPRDDEGDPSATCAPPPIPVPDKVGPPPGALTGRPAEQPAVPQVKPTARSQRPGGDILLLPPIIVAGPPAGAKPAPPASLGHPVPLPLEASAPDLSSALDKVRRSDTRFGGIRWEVRERVVTLSGTVPRGEDLMAFAQAVSRVAGVERVLLGPVRLEPPAGGR